MGISCTRKLSAALAFVVAHLHERKQFRNAVRPEFESPGAATQMSSARRCGGRLHERRGGPLTTHPDAPARVARLARSGRFLAFLSQQMASRVWHAAGRVALYRTAWPVVPFRAHEPSRDRASRAFMHAANHVPRRRSKHLECIEVSNPKYITT